jgi:hypothetical protein
MNKAFRVSTRPSPNNRFVFFILPPEGWPSSACSGFGVFKLAERSVSIGWRGAVGSDIRIGQGSRPADDAGGTG